MKTATAPKQAEGATTQASSNNNAKTDRNEQATVGIAQ